MGQLREIRNTYQKEEGIRRRWFTDDEYWDLYIWSDDKARIVGIQLCYDRDNGERALTWFSSGQLTHLRVIPAAQHRYGAPILQPDGMFDNENVLRRFREDSSDLDERLVEFVIDKIRKYEN
jgi:hypothetical protein